MVEQFSVDLPPGFHPTLSLDESQYIIVTNNNITYVYKINPNAFTEAHTIHIREVTTISQDTRLGYLQFGFNFGLAVCSLNRRNAWVEKYTAEGLRSRVTAYIDDYVACGKTVYKLGAADDNLHRRSDSSMETHGELVTLMHKVNNTLFCFAHNCIYQFYAPNLDINPGYFPIDDVSSVLCVAQDPRATFPEGMYVVYPEGIYTMIQYNGQYFRSSRVVNRYNNSTRAVSACAFDFYVAILFDNHNLKLYFYGQLRQPASVLNVEALGQLCSYRRKQAFNLVTRERIIRYSVVNGQDPVTDSETEESVAMEARLRLNPRNMRHNIQRRREIRERIERRERREDQARVGWESGMGQKRGRGDMNANVIKTMQLEVEWLANPADEEKKKKYKDAHDKLSEEEKAQFRAQHESAECTITLDPLFKIDELTGEYRFAHGPVVVLDCGHIFSKESMIKWRRVSNPWQCPLCKEALKRHRALAQILLV